MKNKVNVPELVQILNRLQKNISRLQLILKYSEKFRSGSEIETRNYIYEIHRAVIVFLHASFEDVFREIIRMMYKNNYEEIIENIPLVGHSESSQPKKFSLKDMTKYTDLKISELIYMSIDHYLNKTSFNSSSEIAGHLNKIKINCKNLNQHFPQLDKMIQRRHNIVHSADMDPELKLEKLNDIDPAVTFTWIATVINFVVDLTCNIIDSKNPDTVKLSKKPEHEELRKHLRNLMTQTFLTLGNLSNTELSLKKE